MKGYFYQRVEGGVRAKEWSYKIPKKLRALPAAAWPEGFRMHGTLWTSKAKSEQYVNNVIQEALGQSHEIRMGRMPASTKNIETALAGFDAWGRVAGGTRGEMPWTPAHAQHIIANCRRWIVRLNLKSPADINQPAFRVEIVKMRTREGKGGKGLAPNTVNHKAWSLITWCRWMVEEKLLPAMPIAYKNLDRTPRKERGKFTPDEVRRLIQVSPPRDAIIYHTAYVTSYRKTSISKIKVAYIDWAALTIGLHYLDNKNRKKTAKPMPPRLAAAVWELCKGKDPDALVFDWFKPKQAVKRLRRNMARAGVPLKDDQGRVRDFHSIKGSFGSALDTLGEDPVVIQRALDHADFKQTLAYIKRDMGPMRTAATTVESALFSSATPRGEEYHDFSTDDESTYEGEGRPMSYKDGRQVPHPPPATSQGSANPGRSSAKSNPSRIAPFPNLPQASFKDAQRIVSRLYHRISDPAFLRLLDLIAETPSAQVHQLADLLKANRGRKAAG